MPDRLSHQDYLASVEQLAKAVVSAAIDEWGGTSVYSPDSVDRTPLKAAITELAQSLRETHSEDDGCLNRDDA
jgi:hypothetical protein